MSGVQCTRSKRAGRALRAGVAALALAGLAACGGGGDQQPPAGGQAAGGQGGARTLTVSAAASLRDVYTALGQQFQQANPGTTVRFNFGGSDTLAQQIVQGAPADVLATASTKTMQTAQQAGRIDGPTTTYATNKLQIATAPGNPKNLRTLQDLARPDVSEVVCAPSVPCGAAAVAAEKAAGVTLTPVSEEQDVKAVLQRVQTGNADAGLVYLTDVRSTQGKVAGTDFPEASAQGATQSYPIGVVTGSAQADLARSFVGLVTGPQGKKALADAGFAVTP